MCGFYGESFIFNRNALDNIELLLSKRGSDELNTDVINNVFMMHSRLSITGTKHKSSQPIHSASGRYCIVFNGEIYSIFGEERSYIQEYGDTLALIKAIEKYGIEDCLLRLNGMFSIVIYDTKLNQLYMSNDYFGQKPLYYRIHQDLGISFGSTGELLSSESVENKKALWDYLSYGFVLPRNSIYNDVTRVLPGSLIKYNLSDNSYSYEKYYQNNNYYLLEDPDKLDNALSQSLIDHSCSDFPMALALSGGIDSTLVYGAMSKDIRNKVESFTVASDEPEEEGNARVATEFFGEKTNLVDSEMLVNFQNLKDIISCLDEPNSDSAILSSSSIFKLASKNAKVIFLGDGGDELFQGYNRHRFWNALDFLNKVPSRLTRFLISIIRFVLRQVITKKKFIENQKLRILYNVLENLEDKRLFILSSLAIDSFDRDKYVSNDDVRVLKNINDVDRDSYLPGNNLYRVDRLSLLYNIEARAPLLDLRIANISNNVEFNKVESKNKLILRNLRNKIYYSARFDNKKMGFNININDILSDSNSGKYINVGLNKAQELGFPIDVFKMSARRKFNLLCLGLWLEGKKC